MPRRFATLCVLGLAWSASAQNEYNGGAYCPILGPGPDVTLCELYGFDAFRRVVIGGIDQGASGATVGTTSWNVGTAQLLWEQAPDPHHPFITANVYRLKDGRFEQIAAHGVKHGFFAFSDTQCVDAALGPCQATDGSRLGIACTDTYTPGLNGSVAFLGPRFEVNPWTGAWSFAGSEFEQGGGPTYQGARLMRLLDDDVDMTSNPGARYFVEGCYITSDDICIYNSAAFKEVFITSYDPDAKPNFTAESDQFTPPYQSFAIMQVWEGALVTEIAEQMPPVKGVSPDGRAIVGAHVTDLGDGTWRYDYTVFNVDMDRQIDQFWVDVPGGVTISDLQFYAPAHYDEQVTYEFNGGMQGPPANNAPWTGVIEVDKVRWFTNAHQPGVASNPIRWMTAYSFAFTADAPPTQGTMAVTAYKPGAAGPIAGVTRAPGVECPGDIDGSGTVDLDDLQDLLFAFGTLYDLDDLQIVLFNFGSTCGG